MAYFVYILRCGDGSLYTGTTNDVPRRLAVHRSGKGAKYTRSHPPVELVYQEALADRSAALRRELVIKGLNRSQKLELIAKGSGTMTAMRRKDRACPAAEAWEILEACGYAVLAMTAEDGAPYAIPLHMVRSGGCVYFHSAMAGRKADCLRKHPRVCLTCVREAEVLQGQFTTRYASAVAMGTAQEVEDEGEKLEALRLLCLRHTPTAMAGFDKLAAGSLTHTAVWKITVEELSGKRNKG